MSTATTRTTRLCALALSIAVSLPANSYAAGAPQRRARAPKAQVVNPVCTKLMREFIRSEIFFGGMDRLNRSIIKSEEDFINKLEPAGAVTSSDRLRLRSAKQDLHGERTEYLARSDRTVTLLIGHKCPLPDHTPSPFTYDKEHDACDAARKVDPKKRDGVCDIAGIEFKKLNLPVEIE